MLYSFEVVFNICSLLSFFFVDEGSSKGNPYVHGLALEERRVHGGGLAHQHLSIFIRDRTTQRCGACVNDCVNAVVCFEYLVAGPRIEGTLLYLEYAARCLSPPGPGGDGNALAIVANSRVFHLYEIVGPHRQV